MMFTLSHIFCQSVINYQASIKIKLICIPYSQSWKLNKHGRVKYFDCKLIIGYSSFVPKVPFFLKFWTLD